VIRRGYHPGMNATEIFYTALLFLMLGLAGAFGLYVLWRLKG